MTTPDPFQPQFGKPPHVGWWCVREMMFDPGDIWRWWNGKCWSFAALVLDSAAYAQRMAEVTSKRRRATWCHHWPAGARVARVNPDTFEVTGEGPDLISPSEILKVGQLNNF